MGRVMSHLSKCDLRQKFEKQREMIVRELSLRRLIALVLLIIGWVVLSCGLSWLIVHRISAAGPFLYCLVFVIAWGTVGWISHRMLMHFFPLLPGEIEIGSHQELV